MAGVPLVVEGIALRTADSGCCISQNALVRGWRQCDGLAFGGPHFSPDGTCIRSPRFSVAIRKMASFHLQGLAMTRAGITVIALSAALFTALCGSASAQNLGAAEIKHMVTGRTVYLATPLGGELPLNYRPSGKVDADGDAVGLGKFFKPKDSGRWWVSGEKLCQKWQTWYDGKTQCFTLQSAGGDKLRWKQDNGDTGTARIAG